MAVKNSQPPSTSPTSGPIIHKRRAIREELPLLPGSGRLPDSLLNSFEANLLPFVFVPIDYPLKGGRLQQALFPGAGVREANCGGPKSSGDMEG